MEKMVVELIIDRAALTWKVIWSSNQLQNQEFPESHWSTFAAPWQLEVSGDQLLGIIEQEIGIFALKYSDYFESQLSRIIGI